MIATATSHPIIPSTDVDWATDDTIMETTDYHQPVLVDKVIDYLSLDKQGSYIDCTAGEGGHVLAILEKSGPSQKLLAMDTDTLALERARNRIRNTYAGTIFANSSYAHLQKVTSDLEIHSAKGILFDLGLSSFQLESEGRGFSFQRDDPLDMRFDRNQTLTASKVVNTYDVSRLTDILYKYGEEVRARRVARALVDHRPINSTGQLARIIARTIGYSSRKRKTHPATRSFQAIRIEVNQELENLKKGLSQALNLLDVGGRLVVISYHSLEDRIVKDFFRSESKHCICPPLLPTCVCNNKPTLKILTKKIITPSTIEVKDNPRSRSARMRACERLDNNLESSDSR